MSNNIFAHTREAVRVKVKKCEPNLPPEWRKFSVDPQITSLEVLYSLLAKAFDIKSDFSIKYKAYDPAGNEIYLAVLSDWDLDAAFLRIHNISIQTATEPCLMLQIDIKPFTEVKEWDPDSASSPSAALIVTSSAGATPTGSTTRELISPLQQSLGVSQKYVQQMQTKLPGLIMNQMEKTFSMVQKAFNLNEETMAALPPRPPLADNEYRMFLDALGQIQRCDELRKVIFFGGIDPSLRRVVWKHILNVYPNVMNGHQRMDYMRRKSQQYYKLRDTWKTAIKQGYVVGELAYVTSMVKKDVLRTDRLHPFYAGSDDNQNIAALFNILTTYALNHPSVSYCQGMSDIASPLLVTMNDEAQAYICFCAIMSRVRGNFMLDGIAMTQKFAHLTEALSYYDAEFWDYLKAQQADDLLFCYRWLLLELKREFPFEDALRMLEVQWSSLKYETGAGGDREELKLFEKEFVPTTESSVTTTVVGGIPTPSSVVCGNGATPISPSYLMAKPRENAYTKVCALRRQSSSASLNSLSSSMSTSGTHVGSYGSILNSKLDVTKRLNQSLDDNITRHATRRQRRASSKAHQSLDETKMLQLIEGRRENSNYSINNDRDNIDDDVFSDTNHFNFHDTNPFKGDDDDLLASTSQEKQIPKAFLSSSSSSPHGEDTTSSTATGFGNGGGDDNSGDVDGNIDSSSECNSPDSKNIKMPKGIAKLQNKNILSNYNAVSNIIAKQLATNVSEGVKRVSSTGGGHFRDLKEKIAATSRKGLSLEDCNEKSQQKLVKNFNEFLNFASMNKSRVANAEKINATILTADGVTTAANKSKTPSPTHNQISPTLHPLVQLTKGGFASSLDSDSSSLPDTTNNTWSCSTAATAIQQANNLSSNSLQLELNSQLSSLTHTPERTPIAERQRDQSTPNTSNKHQDQGDSSATPDDSQDLDYYPMTTAITRELRLEAENLDRQLFGDLISMKDDDDGKKDSTSSEIEYEKLGKDSLDMVEDLKENEIITCPEVSELMMRRRERDKSLTAKANENKSIPLFNGQIDSNLNIRDGDCDPETQTKTSMVNASKLNPFLDESLLRDDLLPITQNTNSNVHVSSSSNLFNLPTSSTTLPEVLVPISSTEVPDTAAIDEMATTAAEEEVTFSASAAQFSSNSTNTPTPRLPPPSEFGGGNPFLMFLCLTLLLQHRNTIMKSNMDYNEIAMHFDKMVRKHDVTRVLNQARRMYIDYLKNQSTYNPQQKQEQQQSVNSVNVQQQPTSDVNRNATASTSQQQKHSKNNHYHSSSATNTTATS